MENQTEFRTAPQLRLFVIPLLLTQRHLTHITDQRQLFLPFNDNWNYRLR